MVSVSPNSEPSGLKVPLLGSLARGSHRKLGAGFLKTTRGHRPKRAWNKRVLTEEYSRGPKKKQE